LQIGKSLHGIEDVLVAKGDGADKRASPLPYPTRS
jgi:hypothetical protein